MRIKKTLGKEKKINFAPIKITIIYLIFGGIWILFSDSLLEYFIKSPRLALEFQTYKGWFFILCTAFIVYHFVKKAFNEINNSKEQLQLSNERWQFALEGSRDGVWDWDLNTNHIHFSERWKDILGYKKNELESSYAQLKKLIHPEDFAKVNNELQKNIKGKLDNHEIEFRMLAKSGQYKWILSRGKITSRDEDGNPLRMVGTNTDIEQRKTDEKRLKLSEDKFSKVFHSSQDAIAITRMNDGMYLDINEGFSVLCGYQKNELVGKNSLEVNIWRNSEDREILVKHIEKTGEFTNFEAPFRKKDGSIFTGLISAKSIEIQDEKCLLTITRDISERKQMIRELRQSKERYSDLIEHLSSGVIMLDAIEDGNDFVIRDVNKSSERIEGIPKQDFIGKKLSELFTGVSKTSFIDKAKMVWQTGNPVDFPIIHYEDKKISSWQDYYVYKLSSGDVVAIFDDQTEKMQAQQALKESELNYKELSESIGDVFFALDKQLNFTYWNKASQELTGVSSNGIIGNYIFDSFPDIKKIKLKETFEKVILEQNSITRTIPYVINGIEYIFSMTIYPSMRGLSVFVKDITAYKEAQDELKKLSRAVEQSPISILITDASGKIEYMNPKCEEISGFKIEELRGKTPSIFSTHEESSEYYENLWKTILSGNDWKGEFHNKKKNGEKIWEAVSISPIKNSSNKLTHFIAIKEDITERKKTEENLRLAKERAEEMNRLKSNFLANMSHELRTPLVGILGFAEMLRECVSDEEQKKMADTINSSEHRLLETLNSILDLTKIESNKFEIGYKSVLVAPVSEKIVKSFYAAANSKNLSLKLIVKDPDAGALLEEKLYEQILNNLINNAIKFTEIGGVTVEVDSGFEEDKHFTIVRVIDSGIGIPEQSKYLIFDEFRQVSEGLDRNYEGTGLGLTITKKFVQLMNGQISVTSKVDKGSTFTVTFPFLAIENKPLGKNLSQKEIEFADSSPAKDVTGSLPKILLLERDITTSKITSKILTGICTIELAQDAGSVIEKAKSYSYDAFLLDAKDCERIDQNNLISEIRQISLHKDTPIIAFNAMKDSEREGKYIENFNTYYIPGSVNRDSFKDMIKKILNETD